jgi:hypothetical protein
MEELPITVDEKQFETGVREILRSIRPKWSNDVKFKVSSRVSKRSVIKTLSIACEEAAS